MVFSFFTFGIGLNDSNEILKEVSGVVLVEPQTLEVCGVATELLEICCCMLEQGWPTQNTPRAT